MRRSLEDLLAHADELAQRFEGYEPAQAELDAPLPPLMAVSLAQFRRAQAEKELAEAIKAARDQHISWRALGEAIGTTGGRAPALRELRQNTSLLGLGVGIQTGRPSSCARS